jgi:hypothetical protein
MSKPAFSPTKVEKLTFFKDHIIVTDMKFAELQIGKYILISHGRWTRGITVETPLGKQTLRKVDPNDILLISDEPMDDETMSDKVY